MLLPRNTVDACFEKMKHRHRKRQRKCRERDKCRAYIQQKEDENHRNNDGRLNEHAYDIVDGSINKPCCTNWIAIQRHS